MKKKLFLMFLCMLASFAFAEESSCPHHAEHTQLDQRADEVMGFDHIRTSHHFILEPQGGKILAEAKEQNDRQSIDQIRKHFVEISTLFRKGDFSMPLKIHGRVPPGSEEMTRLKEKIQYQYHELPAGAEVRITTTDPDALKAIHEFLRFQIQDHRTGDPMHSH